MYGVFFASEYLPLGLNLWTRNFVRFMPHDYSTKRKKNNGMRQPLKSLRERLVLLLLSFPRISPPLKLTSLSLSTEPDPMLLDHSFGPNHLRAVWCLSLGLGVIPVLAPAVEHG